VTGFPSLLAQWLIQQPRNDFFLIYRDRHRDMLELRARQPDVAAAAQLKPPCPLGDRTLHPCAQGILGSKCSGFLSLARLLDGDVVALRTYGELAWRAFGCSTEVTHRAGAAGCHPKAYPNHRIARHIAARRPFDAVLSLGTHGDVGFPINAQRLGGHNRSRHGSNALLEQQAYTVARRTATASGWGVFGQERRVMDDHDQPGRPSMRHHTQDQEQGAWDESPRSGSGGRGVLLQELGTNGLRVQYSRKA